MKRLPGSPSPPILCRLSPPPAGKTTTLDVELWDTIGRLGMVVYLDRVSTDANISDGPSRYELKLARSLEWDEDFVDLE